jgi:beta-xylosidase
VRRPSIYALLEPGAEPEPEQREPRSPSVRWMLIGLAVVAALIVWAATYDAAALSSDNHVHDTLNEVRNSVAEADTSLSTNARLMASVAAARKARSQATSRTNDELASLQPNLASASTTSDLQVLDLAALHTCLSGVSSAVNASAAADLKVAVNAITAASASCLSLDNSGGGLVYPFDFPDPFVLTDGDEYYAFATNSAAGNIQILESSDLVHWTTVGDALPHVASWAEPGATWAPSVLKRANSYVLYYSALDGTTGDQCISDAVATQPQGPYVDSTKTPLVCQLNQGGSLDPSPYVTSNGNTYLTWKSQGANGSPPTLWAQQMTPKATALVAGPPSPLLTPTQPWQAGVAEGPDMWVSGNSYDLFYAGNNWQTASYAIGVASCTGPLGPCAVSSSQPILSSDATMSGPGGPDVFSDSQGNLWLAFAAWLPGKVGSPNSRPLFIRRISITGETPNVSP